MDELARLNAPAQRLDARAKALATLAFIGIVVSFPRYEVSALTPFFLYPVFLMALGRIPAGYLARKILLAAPLAICIGLFNPLFDRQPVAAIGSLAISGGWLSFSSILLRFILTVGAALALVACTGMDRLGAGLAQLGFPRVFGVQLLLLYRYLFVIAVEGVRLRRGLELRCAAPGRLGLRVYGSLTGHLLLRSLDRADRIHRAMTARGFAGEMRLLDRARFRWADGVFLVGWISFFIVARTWNLADALGRLLLEHWR
jgi:cobalt/nickel transport system permease protein